MTNGGKLLMLRSCRITDEKSLKLTIPLNWVQDWGVQVRDFSFMFGGLTLKFAETILNYATSGKCCAFHITGYPLIPPNEIIDETHYKFAGQVIDAVKTNPNIESLTIVTDAFDFAHFENQLKYLLSGIQKSVEIAIFGLARTEIVLRCDEQRKLHLTLYDSYWISLVTRCFDENAIDSVCATWKTGDAMITVEMNALKNEWKELLERKERIEIMKHETSFHQFADVVAFVAKVLRLLGPGCVMLVVEVPRFPSISYHSVDGILLIHQQKDNKKEAPIVMEKAHLLPLLESIELFLLKAMVMHNINLKMDAFLHLLSVHGPALEEVCVAVAPAPAPAEFNETVLSQLPSLQKLTWNLGAISPTTLFKDVPNKERFIHLELPQLLVTDELAQDFLKLPYLSELACSALATAQFTRQLIGKLRKLRMQTWSYERLKKRILCTDGFFDSPTDYTQLLEFAEIRYAHIAYHSTAAIQLPSNNLQELSDILEKTPNFVDIQLSNQPDFAAVDRFLELFPYLTIAYIGKTKETGKFEVKFELKGEEGSLLLTAMEGLQLPLFFAYNEEVIACISIRIESIPSAEELATLPLAQLPIAWTQRMMLLNCHENIAHLLTKVLPDKSSLWELTISPDNPKLEPLICEFTELRKLYFVDISKEITRGITVSIPKPSQTNLIQQLQEQCAGKPFEIAVRIALVLRKIKQIYLTELSVRLIRM